MDLASTFDILDRDKLLHPPDEIAKFVKRMARREYQCKESREARRFHVGVSIIVQPLNQDFQSSTRPFRAIARDISSNGIGFYHTESIEEPFFAVAIELKGEDEFQVLVEVRRCRRINDNLYDIGGEFVNRTEDGGSDRG